MGSVFLKNLLTAWVLVAIVALPAYAQEGMQVLEEQDAIIIPDSEPMEDEPPPVPESVLEPVPVPDAQIPPAAPAVPGEAGPTAQTPTAEDDEAPTGALNIAVLQGINKVTARSMVLDAPVGTAVKFDRLDITVRACWQSAPGQKPESAALMEVKERKPDSEPTPIFFGWMFASSPGISSLEHPLYDITVLNCKKAQAAE